MRKAYSFFNVTIVSVLIITVFTFSPLQANFVSEKKAFYKSIYRTSEPSRRTPSVTQFSFTLNSASLTSAGIFAQDGTLIKTLWSGVQYNAGTYSQSWDGTDDEGRLVTGSDFNVRVLSSKVRYTWEGVIGNTSANFTGAAVHHAMRRMYGMTIWKNTAYYATYYNEVASSTFKFNIGDIQKKSTIFNRGISTYFTTTDGNNVYWAGDAKHNSLVYATTINNDGGVVFQNGADIKLGYKEKNINAIDTCDKSSGVVTGLSVQRKGKFLFVSHERLNEIHVLNKTTGALIQKLSFNAPRALAVDADDNIWLIFKKNNKTVVGKFAVSENGLLSSLNFTLQGISQPLAVAVSPDSKTVLVADGGESQQLKAFNNNSGAALWTYGKKGGYANDPTVSDDKFYFAYEKILPSTFIAFEQDGSFWIEDGGNDRVQHFSADRKLINRIMYRSISYSLFVDANNPSRVFSDYLEFRIDYSKRLAPDNGSWTLFRNWGYSIPKEWDDKYNRLRCVTTFSNGKTYALLHHISSGDSVRKWMLVELPSQGQLRFTGIELPNNNSQIYPDGSLRKVSKIVLGKQTVFTKRELTGFDNFNNPVWGKEKIIASSPAATRNDPLYWGDPNTLRSGEITSSNILVSFDGGVPPNGSSGWHLGGIKLCDSSWLWRTAFSTSKEYRGYFPEDGSYDIGNNVKHAGSVQLVADRNIFWGYHGEFWKNSQVNKWMHVYDDGLFVGNFGVTGVQVADEEAAAEMAGNSYAAAIVKNADGTLYLYHNDESYHSGVHRWKITGLNTIHEQTIPVTTPLMSHGLSAQYFSGSDLNNINTETIKLDFAINFNWSQQSLSKLHVSNADSFSVCWKGFVQPLHTQLYNFYLKAKGNVRLWVDGNLIIDNNNREENEYKSSSIYLNSNKRYPIRVEYYGSTQAPSVALLWSSVNKQKEIIPSAQLFAAVLPERSKVFNLLENLPHNNVLENNRYGWKRYPSNEDSTDRYKQFWRAGTNIKKYKKSETPDVFARFRQDNDVAFISRDLGLNNTATSWKLYGTINYEGNYFNNGSQISEKKSGGCFFEVLDDNGKVIARLSQQLSKTATAQLFANNKKIAENAEDVLKTITKKSQSFYISCNNGIVTFKYGPYAPVTGVFDRTADCTKPKTIRLYFWSNGGNYDRVIDIEDLYYQQG